jgi:hypothetical protein
MLIPISVLKKLLGMPATPDPVADPILENSSMIAQTMCEAYIGMPMEQDTSAPMTATYYQMGPVKLVRLHEYPTTLISVEMDGATLGVDQYTFKSRTGEFEFTMQRSSVGSLEIVHAPGWTSETLPKDLEMAITNIAIGIYENGGKISSTQSSAGALKSMTMFDAMSMSFDTGATTTDAGSPEGLVSQWAFVLDKYDVDKYVMGSP